MKFEASLERCGDNAVMRVEIVRQFAVDIQRYRITANPDGVQPEAETLNRFNAAYLSSTSPEPAQTSKKSDSDKELDPGVTRLDTPTPQSTPRYVYQNGHTSQ